MSFRSPHHTFDDSSDLEPRYSAAIGTVVGTAIDKYVNFQAEGGRFELRKDEDQVERKSRVTPETSKGNETPSGLRFNPKTTRKNPT